MPLPLKKVKFLAQHTPIPEEVDIISKRKKSTSALYVAMYNGKPQSPALKSSDEVLDYMKGLRYIDQYNIQKLHTVGDSELISKINQKYRV